MTTITRPLLFLFPVSKFMTPSDWVPEFPEWLECWCGELKKKKIMLVTAWFGFALSGKRIHKLLCPNFRVQDDLEVLIAGHFLFRPWSPEDVRLLCREHPGVGQRHPWAVHLSPRCSLPCGLEGETEWLQYSSSEEMWVLWPEYISFLKKAKTPAEQGERTLPSGRSPFTPTWVSDSSSNKNGSVYVLSKTTIILVTGSSGNSCLNLAKYLDRPLGLAAEIGTENIG